MAKKFREIALLSQDISAHMAKIYVLILRICVGFAEAKVNADSFEIDD